MQKYEARATVVTGKVTRSRDAQPWAVSAGERIPIQQVIETGPDGFAHFEVAGGGSFDIFANSRVGFRQNAASAGDLLDVLAGRVRIHLKPTPDQQQQRILTPSAWISASQQAIVAIAIDEDAAMRIDVLEGEVRVQHTLLPRSEPTIGPRSGCDYGAQRPADIAPFGSRLALSLHREAAARLVDRCYTGSWQSRGRTD